MSRPVPNLIPLSDPLKVRARNYAVVYLKDGNLRYVLLYLTSRGSRGRLSNRTTNELTEVSLLNSALRDLELSIVEYYHELEIRYDSALEYLVHVCLGYRYWALAADRLSQHAFNRRKLVRPDRMRALQSFVEATMKQPDFQASTVGLLTEMHGPRWVQHPENGGIEHYYRLLLKSLAGSGDLVSDDGHSYRLAAQALTTLANYELEERRHRDSRARQTVLAFLTAVLVVVGAWPVVKDFFFPPSRQIISAILPSS